MLRVGGMIDFGKELTSKQKEIIKAIETSDYSYLMDLGILEPNVLNYNFTVDEISPLILAVTKGNLGIVQMIVASSTLNINYKDAHGFNALHYAAQYGHLSIFKFLYKYG